MDITYNILKEYKTRILPLIEGEPTIESFVQTVLDLSNVEYTFRLMSNMEQDKVDMIRKNVHKNLTPEEIKIVEEFTLC